MRSTKLECVRALGVLALTSAGCGRLAFDDAHADAAAHDAAVAVTASQTMTNRGSGATSSIDFGDAVAPGDTLVACFTFATGSATLASVNDTLGNPYAIVVGPVVSNDYDHYIAIASSELGGSDRLTVTLSAAVTTAWDLLALDYSGLAPQPFDTAAYDSGTGSAMSSGAISTAVPHELLLAYAHSTGPMAGSGYVARASTSESIVADQVVFEAGSYSASGATSTGIWTLILAGFEAR